MLLRELCLSSRIVLFLSVAAMGDEFLSGHHSCQKGGFLLSSIAPCRRQCSLCGFLSHSSVLGLASFRFDLI